MIWKKELVTLLFAIAIFSCKNSFPENTIGHNEKIPDFNIQLIDSSATLDSKDFSDGNPFIVFFFDPECSYCQSELRSIISNVSYFRNNKIYMVTFTNNEQMALFYNKLNLSRYKNITMGRDISFASLRHYKLNTVPYTLIYDGEGRLKRVFDQKVDAQKLLRAISNL